MRRILIITSFILAGLTFGNIFLKTATIIDGQTAGQRNAGYIRVTAATQTASTMKVIGSAGSCDNKNIFLGINNQCQGGGLENKGSSPGYYVNYNHWDNNDDGHNDEEDVDVYDEEDKENDHDRENA
ncbi:MAG: hypothetical protein PGMFKBFP_01585 [Anaerolineales bacterium]|nr:hypothetical protein [Anaerolineales bacterium]